MIRIVDHARALVRQLAPRGSAQTAPADSAIARNDRTDVLIGWLVFLGALALFLRTMPPTVMDGDSGEYQYVAYILGVPHSPGYPLYVFLGKLFTFLPFGDVAYRVSLLSAVLGALAAPLVYWTARRLIPRRAPALLATLVFMVTPSVWGGAVQAKSYALHLVLGVLTFLFAIRWHQDGKRSDFYWFSLICGLGLTNHPVYRFIAAAPLLLLWFNRRRLTRPMLARGVLIGLVPLLMYAYVPIRANQLIAQQDPANKALYGRPDAMVKGTVTAYYDNDLAGLVKMLTGFDNVNKVEVKTSLESTNRVDLALRLLFAQFGIAGLVFCLVGAWRAFRRDRQIFAILLAGGAGIGLIAFVLHGISTEYYFSLMYFVLALWIGFGIDGLMRWAARVRATTRVRAVAAIAAPPIVASVVLLLPLAALAANFGALDESYNTAPRDYAQTVLGDDLKPNAVVVAPWEVSQPMRYYQFVEGQRPDLLVTNIPPIWPQFQTVLESARKLHRPFYNVEFDPELAATPGPRFVQAIPLPMIDPPNPRYKLSNTRIVDGAEVIGYDLEPDPPQPGKPVRVLVYYRTLARMYPMYSSALTISDITGRFWSDYYGFPGSQYYETFRWQQGDVFREAWQFIWPADAPSGLYNLDLSWYVYNLETRRTDFDHEFPESLGTIRVGNLTPGNIGNVQLVPVGDAISFLGWDAPGATNGSAPTAARGSALLLDLYWRADRKLAQDYTVFVHLTDASGRVVSDADNPPSSGLYPTGRWNAGESVRDHHVLKIPPDLAPGDYAIEIGMYLPASGSRLAIGDSDKIVVTHVKVR